MDISSVLTKDYENEPLRRRGENKPNLSRRSTCCKSAEAGRSRSKPKQSQTVREDLIERGRAASTKAMAAISVANLLQQSSDCHDLEE